VETVKTEYGAKTMALDAKRRLVVDKPLTRASGGGKIEY
jgi:hypothetical protein